MFLSEKENFSNGSRLKMKCQVLYLSKKPESNNSENLDQNKIGSSRNLGRTINRDQPAVHSIETDNAASDPTLPTEWIPPNLSAPLLDLVDVLQLNDGGWALLI